MSQIPGTLPPGVPPDRSSEDGARMRRAYIQVLILNVLIIAALWAFSRHFGN
jgi:hypothetical protein